MEQFWRRSAKTWTWETWACMGMGINTRHISEAWMHREMNQGVLRGIQLRALPFSCLGPGSPTTPPSSGGEQRQRGKNSRHVVHINKAGLGLLSRWSRFFAHLVTLLERL